MELTATQNEVEKVIKILNERGKWIILETCKALAKHEIYRNYESAWTGYFKGIEREENIIFPKWG